MPSPKDPFQAAASPSCGLNILKATEEIIVPTKLHKEDSDRDISIKSSGLQDKLGSKLELGAKPPTDLQTMITSLLKENPKGMSLKVSFSYTYFCLIVSVNLMIGTKRLVNFDWDFF